MLHYSVCVIVATNGKKIRWSPRHTEWLKEYEIPIQREKTRDVEHRDRQILALRLDGDERVEIDYIFTTRGDISTRSWRSSSARASMKMAKSKSIIACARRCRGFMRPVVSPPRTAR